MFYLMLRFGLSFLLRKNPEAAKRLNEIEGKVFLVELTDAKKNYYLRAENERIKIIPKTTHYDVTIKGRRPVFLKLLLNKSDADELFFRRELTIVGDIQAATFLKNILANM